MIIIIEKKILSRQQKLLVYVFICLHCFLPEAATGVGAPVLESLFNEFEGLTLILKNSCQRLLFYRTCTTRCYLSVLLYIQHLQK